MICCRRLFVLLLLVLLATRATAAQPAAKPGKPNHENIKERVKQFDTDGDGKLSDAERATAKAAVGDRLPGAGKGAGKPGGEAKDALHQKVLSKFDANGNGKLDPDEQAAARKAAKERRAKKAAGGDNVANGGNGAANPFGGAGGGAGPTGDGRQKLLERFDFNHDGQLSQQEMQQARQMMEQLRQSGQLGDLNLPPGVALPQGVGRPNVAPQRPFRQ